MRGLILATILITLSPLTLAQTNQGNMGGTSAPAASSGMSNPGRMPPAGARQAGQGMGMGENCGTPDEPKPCPPMPRHPMQSYPPNKQ